MQPFVAPVARCRERAGNHVALLGYPVTGSGHACRTNDVSRYQSIDSQRIVLKYEISNCGQRTFFGKPVVSFRIKHFMYPMQHSSFAVAKAEEFKEIEGTVIAPKGFKASSLTAGLKASGLPDLAMLASEVDAVAAGVFTTCKVCAAPVTYDRQTISQNPRGMRAVIVNSGQANAATGEQGWQDAIRTAQVLADELGVKREAVLIASTGVIGQRVKMDILEKAIPALVAGLGNSLDHGKAASKAICTTDLVPKTCAYETIIDSKPVRVGGMCKGSGMIHPNMATMLAFITCDANVDPPLWQSMLSRAADKSFNQVTVDGDTSTNDSLIGLANGASGTSLIADPSDPRAAKLEAMVTAACQHLARCIARDGEGATVLFEVSVSGAATDSDARKIARTIVGSSLTKAAIYGRDPNWGRIAAAAGRAGVDFDPDQLHIELGPFAMMDKGQPLPFDRAAASKYMADAAKGAYLKDDTVLVQVSVGNGPGVGKSFGCDLTYDYVKINAEYTT